MQKQILGRDPAFILAAIQAGLAMALSFGWLKFIGLNTQVELGYLVGVIAAASAVYLAWGTSETMLSAIVELFKGAVSLGAIYGLNISTEQTGLAIAFITAIFTAFLRTQTSPLAYGSFGTISPDDTRTPGAGEVGAADPLLALGIVLIAVGLVLWLFTSMVTVGIVLLVVGVVVAILPFIRR